MKQFLLKYQDKQKYTIMGIDRKFVVFQEISIEKKNIMDHVKGKKVLKHETISSWKS